MVSGAVLSAQDKAIQAHGLIIPLQDIIVSANAKKLITKIHVGEGDSIGEGEVLAELDATMESIEVRRLEKVLQSRTFDNSAGQKLLKRSMISKEEALDRQLEFEIAGLQLEAAKQN